MKTLAFCLTSVFVTLKVVDKLTWSWFWALCPAIFWIIGWVALFIVYNAASIQDRAAQIKANRKRQEEIDETNRRINDLQRGIQNTAGFQEHMKDQYKSIKTIALILLTCATIYGCRPSGKIMKCPNIHPKTFNK